MAKTKKKVVTAAQVPTVPTWSDQFTDPAQIFESIEHESTGTADADPYRARIEQLMRREIDAYPDPDTQQDLTAIRSLFHGNAFEDIARKTGFVLGFEFCRRLMVPDGVDLAKAVVEYFGDEEINPHLDSDIKLRDMARAIVVKGGAQ